MKKKIIFLDDLIKKVDAIKKSGKKVVQSHGVFDIIHPGIITHLNSAKEQGDILVVTIIKDKDVRRGPGRPVFPELLRAENAASLSQVDYVCIVDDGKPFECVSRINPDVFAKGQSFKDRDGVVDKKIFEEQKDLYFGKSRIHLTNSSAISSTEIIKNFLDIYPVEVKNFLKEFLKKYSFDFIEKKINNLQKMRILLIGDGIIDEYHYCESLGRSAKAPLVVNRYLTHEVFAGGAFAIANHIATFCDEVHLISLVGNDNSREKFIRMAIPSNVKIQLFKREDGPTIVKKRYVHQYLNHKLFEVNYLNDAYINANLESDIIGYLQSVISSYDVVLISDFGHGFITNKIIKFIEKHSRKFAVNTQTNAANTGYNMITKYRNPNYVCLDEDEIRLSAQERYLDIESVAKKISRAINSDYLIVTRGKKGSMGINKTNVINRTPIFSTKVIDTVGAGDAFFAYTAPCVARGFPLDLVSFIGNVVGALAVQIVGNKKPVEKEELIQFIHSLLE